MGRRSRRRGETPLVDSHIESRERAETALDAYERPHWPPSIAIGCPVADRAWVLPEWYRCIEHQTMQPEYVCFVHSESDDGGTTWEWLERGLVGGYDRRIKASRLPYFSRAVRNADPNDPHRAHHLSAVRNELRSLFVCTDADVIVSLDSDILLQDETALERMVTELYGPRRDNPRAEWGWDVVCPLVNLHRSAPCYNAAWWRAGFRGDPQRVWERAGENARITHPGRVVKVDVPMAAFAAQRSVWLNCRYKFHESGEDMGFGDDLEARGYRVGWMHELQLPHAMDPLQLEEILGARI